MKHILLLLIIVIGCIESADAQSRKSTPPSPSLIYDYRVDSAGIFLGLMPSSTRNVTHHLYRKTQKTNQWTLIESFAKSVPPIYQDKGVISASPYSYKWVAENTSGQQSNADHSMIHLTAFDMRNAFRPEVTITETDEGLSITVTNDIPGADYRIEIIRAEEDRPYRTATVLQEGSTYLDKGAERLTHVRYKARILYRDGKRSKYGREVSHLRE